MTLILDILVGENVLNPMTKYVKGGTNSINRKSKSLVFYILVLVAHFLPVNLLSSSDKISRAVNYLSRYGYIPPVFTDSTASNQLTKEIVSQGLWDLQDFFGLNRTGILDDATLRLMATPRCGLPDKVYRRSNRRKRYTLMGSKWTHSNITYFIRNYSENIGQHMDKKRVKSDIRMALDVWSKHSPLTFTGIKSESADIIILWGKRRHGDKQPFDGPGGTLAHAYTPGPGIGGDTHFDDDETWTAGVDHGTNLLQAATHELGHALGLGHSRLTKAVMAPTYKGYEADLALDEDDIRGITYLYKFMTINTKAHGSKHPTRNTMNELCHLDEKIDTMFTDAYLNTYVFVDSKFWEITEEGISSGYPKSISSRWPRAPSNIDAALNYNKHTYFFKGSKYWRYNKHTLIADYPKPISKGFAGVPDNIDAAFMWKGKIHFFKGKNYYKYTTDLARANKVVGKPISKWRGVPNDITAAFQDKKNKYFILKKGKYYKLRSETKEVDTRAKPPYPRPFKDWWLNCGKPPMGLNVFL